MFDLLKLFSQLPDGVQVAVFLALLVATIAQTVWTILSWRSQGKLKRELRRVRGALTSAQEERNQLQRRFEALDQVDDHVWKRPDVHGHNRFVSRAKRKTRFVAVCNLKGGVGKTTITANVGVGLALRGRKVLLVDLDFQGTLSNFLLDRELLQEYREKGWTTDALLIPQASAELVGTHAFAVQAAPQARVLPAREALEIVEFAQQARFYVDPKNEARFHLQRLLHADGVAQDYDYVFFDCPPRMTTSCINALTCADFLLLPTSLSEVDIDAARRTLTWLRELRPIIGGDFLGVILSQCHLRGGDLIRFEKGQLDTLESLLAKELSGSNHVFKARIPDHPEIHKATADRRPFVLDPRGRAWFDPLCDELERRVHP